MRFAWLSSAVVLVLACSGDEFTPQASGTGGLGGTGDPGGASGGGGPAGGAPAGGNSGGTSSGGSAGALSNAGADAGGAEAGGAGGIKGGSAGVAGISTGGAGGAPKPTRIVHVSPTGDPASEGLQPAAPTTLAHAVTLATKDPVEARLCVGLYDLVETLALPPQIAVRGGYDCGAFAQQTALGANAGQRCNGDLPALRTTLIGKDALSPVLSITSGSVRLGTSTLSNVEVVGTGVGVLVAAGAPVIEASRVAIRGTSAANGTPTTGIYVDGGAATIKGSCVLGGVGKGVANAGDVTLAREPGSTGITITGDAVARVEDCKVEGGSGEGNGSCHGSVGLLVRNGSPTVVSSTLEGGSGRASRAGCVGSAALLVDSWNTDFSPAQSTPKLEKNTLLGGTGTQTFAGGTPSVGLALLVRDGAQPAQKGPGIRLTATKGNAVSNNVIHGGSGVSSAAVGCFSRGVLGEGGADKRLELELVDNTITGREQKTTTSPDGSIGVSLDDTKGAVRRNTIIGGRALANDAYGVRLRRTTDLVVENNFVSGGEVTTTGTTLAALFVDRSPRTIVRHNTLHNGIAPQILRSRAVLVASGTPSETAGLVLDANLVLGSPNGENVVALQLEGCNLASLASFENNAFVGFGERTVRMPMPNCTGNPDHDVVALTGAIATACGAGGEKCPAGVPSTKGSAEIRNACKPTQPACIGLTGCTDLASCGPKLFQGFVSGPPLLDALSKDAAFQLLPGGTALPCEALSTISPSPPGAVDRFGSARTAPTSRGAFEQAGCL